MIDEEIWRQMLREAVRASNHAYAPYSEFPVGAAALGSDGNIYSACNVENASFGLTICAERSAIFAMVAEGLGERDSLVALAVYTPTTAPTPPCGACRQVIAEFGAGALIRSYCDSDARIEATLEELLPLAFEGP